MGLVDLVFDKVPYIAFHHDLVSIVQDSINLHVGKFVDEDLTVSFWILDINGNYFYGGKISEKQGKETSGHILLNLP